VLHYTAPYFLPSAADLEKHGIRKRAFLACPAAAAATEVDAAKDECASYPQE